MLRSERIECYSIVFYCIAVINHLFSVTLEIQIPEPQFILRLILCAFLWSQRRTKPLLTWLLLIVVCFFPECGLVLFMSLYYWVSINICFLKDLWHDFLLEFSVRVIWKLIVLLQTLQSSFGTAELIFWLFRVVMNVSCNTKLFIKFLEKELVGLLVQEHLIIAVYLVVWLVSTIGF